MKYRGRGRKTWGECVRKEMELLGLQLDWAIFSDVCVEGLDIIKTLLYFNIIKI